MNYATVTDIGRVRKLNEDSCYYNDSELFPYGIVADGMGGHAAGEVASSMLVDILQNHLVNKLGQKLDYVEAGEEVRHAIIAANGIIYNYSKEHYKVMGMGTTVSFAMLYKKKLITAQVGDSRVYLIKGNKIEQITKDHSYVQELLTRGEITPEEAKNHPKKNFITRAIGVEDYIKVDVSINDYKGGIVFICSDGLTNLVEDNEILKAIKGSKDLQKTAQELVDLANERGGRDNISIVVFGEECK